MPDSSEDFFNNFGGSPQASRAPAPQRRPSATSRRPSGPPPARPPPQARPAAPARPPPQARPAAPARRVSQKQQPSYMLSSSGVVGGQQSSSAATVQPSYYGQQQSAPAPAPNDFTNEWYSGGSNNSMQQDAGMAQQQQMQPTMQQQQPLMQPTYNTSGFGMEGSMDTSGGSGGSGPSTFVPQTTAAYSNNDSSSYYYDDLHNEPPLLEELGINIEHIVMKTKAVVIPFRRFQKNSALADPTMIVEDADLAGPLALALALGGELLISGKVSFGYIYGFGLFGCLAMTLILNLMSPENPVSFWTVTSILGYALLPVNLLALFKIVLFSVLTRLLAVVVVLWSTTASTRLLEVGCGLANQRFLLAYPIALLYSAFVLITIF